MAGLSKTTVPSWSPPITTALSPPTSPDRVILRPFPTLFVWISNVFPAATVMGPAHFTASPALTRSDDDAS